MSSAVGPESRVAAVEHVECRREGDDGALLYDRRSEKVAVLNPSAAAVWALLDGERTIADVVGALETEYDGVDPEAAAQVLRLVQEFVDRGAVVVVGGRETHCTAAASSPQ
jgi:hypothetical protein